MCACCLRTNVGRKNSDTLVVVTDNATVRKELDSSVDISGDYCNLVHYYSLNDHMLDVDKAVGNLLVEVGTSTTVKDMVVDTIVYFLILQFGGA